MGKRNASRTWLVAALVGILSGCSAVQHLSGSGPVGTDAPAPYGGMRTLFSDESATLSFYQGMGKLAGNVSDSKIAAILFAPFVADLGLSFLIDTLLLPVSLSRLE